MGSQIMPLWNFQSPEIVMVNPHLLTMKGMCEQEKKHH